MNLCGRSALVTGAGRGIGAAIALRLAQDGAAVVVNDLDANAADETAERLTGQGLEAFAWRADVGDAAQVKKMVSAATEKLGKIDILVNNAGTRRDAPITEASDEDWEFVLRVNLKTAFLCTREVVPSMIAQRYGRIINISSRGWLGGGHTGRASYAASKAGVVGLTRTLSLELASEGITVNCVAPGIIDSPMFYCCTPDEQEAYIKSQPMLRLGVPEDIAYAVAFFAAEEANYITGQTLYVCGGRSIGVTF